MQGTVIFHFSEFFKCKFYASKKIQINRSKKGFYRNSADVCTDYDECSSNMHSCSPASICRNTPGSFECECLAGYEGVSCEDIDECSNNKCDENEKCQNTVGSFYCDCKTGFNRNYSGSCIDIDECYVKRCPDNKVCINEPGSYQCKEGDIICS